MSLILPKTKINGLPIGEDGIILRSFVLTQYRHDGQMTHRQNCCS